MRITSVTLMNIGIHRSLHVDMSTGLTGIVGSNGSGKSTLVNSIYAALTNDFTRFSKVKADIITTDVEENSGICIKGIHQGTEFELTRNLRPNSSKLKIDGVTYTKSGDIDIQLQERLGVSRTVIDNYVFVNQWDMFQFLSQRPSERAKAFQLLCGIEAAERIHKVCSDYLATHQVPDVIDNTVELSKTMSEHKQEMARRKEAGKKAMAVIEGYPSIDELRASFDKQSKLIERHKILSEVIQSADTVKVDLETSREKLKELEKKLAFTLKSYESSGGDDRIHMLKDVIKNRKEFQSLSESLEYEMEEVTAKSAEMEELMAKEVKPPESSCFFKDADQLNEAKAQSYNFEQELKTKQARLSNIESSGSSICDSCGQEIGLDSIERLQNEIKLLTQNNAKLRVNIKRTEAYNLAVASHAKRLRQCKEEVDAAVRKFESIKERLDIYTGREDCNLDSDKIETSLNLLEQDKLKINEYQKEVHLLTGLVDKYESKLKDIEQLQLSREKVSSKLMAPKDIYSLKENIQKVSAALRDKAVAASCFNQAKEAYRSSAALYEKQKAAIKSQKEQKEAVVMLADVRDLFHWSNLPKQVAQANLELLIDDINDNLTIFDSPFHVEANTDLSFDVYLPGYSAIKSTQLSGGQKVILSIAFRAAIDKVFGHNIGMLFLDEPTVGLDADNLRYFYKALQKLATRAGNDRQLVIITHVHELDNVFDQLIEL